MQLYLLQSKISHWDLTILHIIIQIIFDLLPYRRIIKINKREMTTQMV